MEKGKYIEKEIQLYEQKMNKAEREKDMETYNKCVVAIQTLEKVYEELSY